MRSTKPIYHIDLFEIQNKSKVICLECKRQNMGKWEFSKNPTAMVNHLQKWHGNTVYERKYNEKILEASL
jgi:hypothetical protein